MPVRTPDALLADAVLCPLSTPATPPTISAATRASAGVRRRVQLFFAGAAVAGADCVVAACSAGGTTDAGGVSLLSTMVVPFVRPHVDGSGSDGTERLDRAHRRRTGRRVHPEEHPDRDRDAERQRHGVPEHY